MHNFQQIPRRLALLTVLSLVSFSALPQSGGRYTVEIVVFRIDGTAAADARSAAHKVSGADVAATPSSARRLSGSAARIKAAKGYRLLAHTAWTQSAAAWNSRRGVSTSTVGLSDAVVQGKVIVERGQFLHLGFDLTVEDDGKVYRLNEVRRVKPDEPQYFDHPAVGIIALLTQGG
jgi:hypothetical protein